MLYRLASPTKSNPVKSRIIQYPPGFFRTSRESIHWRQKEQFSDGVGYSWIDTLKEVAAQQVSDQQLETARFRFPYNTPTSKEAYLYREIFEELFPLPSAAECVPGGPSVACSSAKAIEWDEAFKKMDDPSGRAVGVHQSAYK